MFTIENSILLIIDVQGKLAPLMHDKERVIRHIQGLIQAAQHLAIPIIFTEQVPEKIGPTIPELTRLLHHHKPIVKTAFSCCGEKEFTEHLRQINRHQVIVTGIETHVCVCQTVSDLLAMDYHVQAVADAVSSRALENKAIGLRRMESLGAVITSAEMIITELIRTSRHPKFKEILGLIK